MSEKNNKFNHLSEDIINSLPGSFFVVDGDTRRLIHWNKNFEKLTGYMPEELSKMTLLDFSTPDEKKLTAKTIEKIIKTGNGSAEQFIVAKTGKKIPHYFSARLLTRDHKKYIVGMGLDITDQRKAIETVKRERTVSDAIISGLPGTFFVIDLKTLKVVRWSSNFEKVGGYTKKEILNMSPEDIVCTNDRQTIREAIKKVSREGRVSIEACILSKDGKKTPNYISAALFSEDDHQYIAGIGIDISERKEAEKALLQSEEKFHTMFDTMTQGVCYVDSQGRITSFNEAAEKISGISFARAKGKTVAELNIKAVHEDGFDFPVETRPLQVALRTGTQIKNKVMAVFNRKEKRYRWINVTAIPKFRTGNDEPFEVYGIAEDITEQKEAEREQAKLSAVIETTPDFAGLADENATAIYVNKAGRKMAGISETEDITKYKISDFHPKWAAEKVQKEGVPEAVEKGSWVGETAILDREGKVTPVLQVILSHKNPDGSIVYFSTIAHDISERKKSEEKLKESEEKYRTLVDTSPDTVITTDMKAQITFASTRTLDYFGYKPEELLEMNSFDLIVPEEREKAIKAFQDTVKKGFVRNAEFALLKKDGSKFIAEINATIVKDIRGKPKTLISTMRDITERKRIEEILKNLATRFASIYGTEFFNQVCAHVAEVLGAEYAFIGRLTPDKQKISVIGGVNEGEPLGPMEYDLEGTPCDEVMGKEVCVFQEKVQELFPKDKLLVEMGSEGYAGIPLYSRTGEPLGIFVVMSKKPIRDEKLAIAMMTGYSERVSAEIERSEAEEGLIISEEKYSSLVERSNDGIVIIQDQELRFVNTMMTKLTGFSKKEATGKPFVDFIAPEYKNIVVERYKSRMAGKEVPSKYKIEIITKKRALVPVELSMSVIEYEGKPADMALMRDITERKKADRERETLLHDIGERYKEINGLYAISKIFEEPNISLDQIFKKSVKLIPPAWQYPEITCAKIVIDGREYKTSNFEKTKWVQSADIEVAGKIVGQVSASYLKEMPPLDEGPFLKEERDLINAMAEELSRIIESKESDEALKKSEQRFRVTFENAPIGVGLVSLKGRFIQVNASWAKMLGYSVEALEKIDFQTITHPDDLGASSKALKALMSGKVNTWQAEKRYLHKNGQIIWILLNTTLARDEQKKPLYFISEVQDITERKKTEGELKQKDRDIRRAYVDVLSAVTGGKLILETEEEIEKALGEPVSKVYRADSYKDLGKIRAKIRNKIETNFPRLEEKDDMLLAAGEALTNSIKHARGGDVRIYKKKQFLQILIKDTGPGIDFSTLPKATLLSGFSTAKSLGVGFDVMLEFSDRVLLFTEPAKTIIVLEKFADGKEKQIAV